MNYAVYYSETIGEQTLHHIVAYKRVGPDGANGFMLMTKDDAVAYANTITADNANKLVLPLEPDQEMPSPNA